MRTNRFSVELRMALVSMLLAAACSTPKAQKLALDSASLSSIASRPVVTYTDAWDEPHGTVRRTWSTGDVVYQIPSLYRYPNEAPGAWVSDAEYAARARDYIARAMADIDRQMWRTVLSRPCEYSYRGC